MPPCACSRRQIPHPAETFLAPPHAGHAAHAFARYKEWYYDALVPFVHYIPIALDLSDLCEKLEWMKANQTAAAQMSASRAA